MDYAKDLHTGKIVAAEDASGSSAYSCPRPACGGRVYLPDVRIQRPHFRHYPGEGTPACDEYFPGAGAGGTGPANLRTAVEDEPSELGLLIEQMDHRWGLLLRLPEIPSLELGHASLATLRTGFVEVFAGSERLARVSALDFRPGVGTARVEIPPSLQSFRSQPTGDWPAGIAVERWRKTARAMAAVGTLFRLRGGEWVRLSEASGVHWGEELIVLADARCPPARSIVVETSGRTSSAGFNWSIWQVRLPDDAATDVEVWLSRLGHSIVPRPWSTRLATPPRGYSDHGEPLFWLEDAAIFELEAPTRGAESVATLVMNSNSHGAGIKVGESRRVYVAVSSHAAGLARLAIAHERSVGADVAFQARPDAAALRGSLDRSARLRLWVGEICLEAWRDRMRAIRVAALDRGDIRLETGIEGVRVHVTVWSRGKRRTYRQLAQRDAESILASALSTASRLEVDAENLGRLELRLLAATEREADRTPDRLAWWEQAARSVVREGERTSPALVAMPGRAGVLRAESLGAAGLVRARLAGRKRRQVEGSTP